MKNIKFGIETESLHLFFQHKKIDIFDFVDIAKDLKFDGVVINIIKDLNLNPRFGTLASDDEDYLLKLSDKIKSAGLYCEIDTRSTDISRLKTDLKIAKSLEAKILRTYIVVDKILTKKELDSAIADLKELVCLLKEHDITLALENHEWESADDILYVLKGVNSKFVKALYDTGNSMMVKEDPFLAAKKLSKQIASVHFKDHIVCLNDGEPVISGVPIGEGSIDAQKMFDILVNESEISRINMETCYPYSATIKDFESQNLRNNGQKMRVEDFTKDGFKFKGVFEIKEPPFENFIKPMEYYYPHKIGQIALSKLMNAQMECVKKSAKRLFEIRENYLKNKE